MVPLYRLVASVLFLGALVFLLSLVLGVLTFISGALLKIAKFALISRYYSYPLSFKQASLIEMVGISFATLTSGRVGEGSKALLMNRPLEVPISSSFSIVILERLFDVVVLSAGAFLLSFYMRGDMALLAFALFLFLIICLFIFLRFADIFKTLVPENCKRYFAVKIKDDKFQLSLIHMPTLFVWMLKAASQWFMRLSFNVYLPFYIVFGIVCIGAIAVIFSVMPAGIGTLDLSYLLLYLMAGVPMEAAASVLLIYRFFSILMPFLSTVLLLNYYQLSVTDVRAKMEN